MTTWTKTPPTEECTWLWCEKIGETVYGTDVRMWRDGPSLFFKGPPCLMAFNFGPAKAGKELYRLGGYWSPLIPADVVEAERAKWRAEVLRAFREVMFESVGEGYGDLWLRSRARRIATGEEEPTL